MPESLGQHIRLNDLRRRGERHGAQQACTASRGALSRNSPRRNHQNSPTTAAPLNIRQMPISTGPEYVRHALQQNERRSPNEAAENKREVGHGGRARCKGRRVEGGVIMAVGVGGRSLLVAVSRMYLLERQIQGVSCTPPHPSFKDGERRARVRGSEF